MTRPTIVHLIDDTTAGGVMRLLDFIRTDPGMARLANHDVQVVKRGALSVRRIKADLIVSHLSVSWRTLPALVSLRAIHSGLPLIHVEHSYTQHFTALNVPNKDRFLTLLRVAYSMFDRVVAVSQAQGDWMLKRGLVHPDALCVIPPMVDLSGFAALPSPAGLPKRIGAIGRLDRQKGFDLLVQAFRALPNADLELVFYGDGPQRAELEALAGNDARIRFAGHLNDPERAMASVDAVAMPSRWEAYGLVAREARAAGRPVLVSGHDGLLDQVGNGAIRVSPFTVSGWTAALAKLAAGQQPVPSRSDITVETTRFTNAWADLLNATLPADAETLLAA